MNIHDPNEQGWIEDIRAELERSADELDSITVARLAAARARAVERAMEWRERHSIAERWWLPAGAFASVVLTAAVLGSLSTPVEPVHGIEDLELLSGTGDIEFYEWLQELEQEQAG